MLSYFCKNVTYIIFAFLSCAEYQFLCKGKLNFNKYFKFRDKIMVPSIINVLIEEHECPSAIKYLLKLPNVENIKYSSIIINDIQCNSMELCCIKGYLNSLTLIYYETIYHFDLLYLSITYNQFEIFKYLISKQLDLSWMYELILHINSYNRTNFLKYLNDNYPSFVSKANYMHNLYRVLNVQYYFTNCQNCSIHRIDLTKLINQSIQDNTIKYRIGKRV